MTKTSRILALALLSLFLIALPALAQPAPSPVDAADGLGKVAASYGGWGLSGILMAVVAVLARKIDTMTTTIMTLVTKQTEVMTEHNINTRRTNELLEDVRRDRDQRR